MIRILWISDLVAPTGFSRVSHSIIKYLPRDKFEVIGLGINHMGDPHDYTFPIFPARMHPADIYGHMRIEGLMEVYQPNLIFILNDAWVQKDYLQDFIDYSNKKQIDFPKIVTYTPADAEDHNPAWYKDFDKVSAIVAYTEFGRGVIEVATEGKYDVKIINHGVDTSDFYKLGADKSYIRRKVFGNNDSKDYFIVLNANRNQPRKRLDISMKAFAEFSQGKDDARYYAHCGVTDDHIDIIRMATRLGIDEKLILTSLNPGIQRVTTEQLNEIYNICDVGLNTSLGEGFGLVNVEHAVTGAPQIVGNYSSMGKLHEDVGLVVDPITEWTIDKITTTGKIVSPHDVAEKLEILYSDRDLLAELSQKNIDKFSSDEFSWKLISEQWAELFKSVLKGE